MIICPHRECRVTLSSGGMLIMNLISRLFCRVYQLVFRIALPFLPYRQPRLFSQIAQMNRDFGFPEGFSQICAEDIPI